MFVALLGPLEVRTADGDVVHLGGRRLRNLLLRLALAPGRVVTYTELAASVWDDDRPESPTAALHALVARLRRALPALPLRSTATGYSLDLPPAATDVGQFEGLVAGGGRLELGPARGG